jgi:fructose-specific phosphotransferase system IIC component
MSNLVSAGIFILVLSVFYSRSISKEALELLDDDQKNTLALAFRGFGWVSQLPLIIVFAGYVGISLMNPEIASPAFVVLILLFFAFLIGTYMVIVRRLNDTDLPGEYIKRYKRSRMLYNGGFIVCGVILLYELIIS